MSRKLFALVSLIVAASMLLSACQPTEVIKTVEVTKEVKVVETKEVKTEVEVTKVIEVQAKAFTTPHPILGDVKVRQAIEYCTNKLELVKSVYPLISEEAQKKLVMDSFVTYDHWAYAGDAISKYPYDPEKGKALLEEAGWKLADGADVRSNEAGEALSLKFTTTSAAFRQTWAAVFESQMAACGIGIVRLHAPASWWFGDTTGLARRDYELGAYAWVGQADPGGQTLYACDQIPSPENAWEGQNTSGWCDEEASAAIKNANNTLIKDERIKNYAIVQKAYTRDVPVIPLFNRTETFAYAADLQNFKPTPGQEYYNYNVYEWEIPGKDTLVVGFTQEPASLFLQNEDAWVAHLAGVMMGGPDMIETSLNYDYQPAQVKQLATIENNKATNNDVEVKEGDKIYDADGNVVELKAGVKIKDTTGADVEFKGGTAKMKQLVVTYEWKDGTKWSDGEPLKAADFELYYKVRCDRDSGATSYINCDKTQKIEFADNGYTVTWLPGVQDPLYFRAPYYIYPSHRKLADGRMLADVPAKEWATLIEVAEMPIDIGPYILKEWVKGEKMVFEANPNYVLGEPKTKNLVIAFVSAENAEAQLLGGQVDLLGSETLAGLTETLANAEKEGKIKTAVIAGATWEHIDIGMFLK